MRVELFNIIRNKVFHWFVLSFGNCFIIWLTSIKWYDIKTTSLGIRFGNKEYVKDW